MAATLELLVRVVHVLGATLLLGGAAFAWTVLRTAPPDSHALLVRYEWAFWGALGAMVVTGVGNLGALGAPGPATRWGAVFSWKLLLVVALVVGSFLRTLIVLRGPTDRSGEPAGVVALRRLYALTTVSLVLVVALAEVLAHG